MAKRKDEETNTAEGAYLPQRPRTREDLRAWLAEHLGLRVADAPMIEGHAAPLDYLCHAFFDGRVPDHDPAPPDCIVWASRGGGKTFLGAVATALDLLYKPGIQVRILGGSLEQSQRMHAHLVALFEREWLAPHIRGRITERRIRLTNGSGVELLAQSAASVRGTRVQKVRCDEVELFDPRVWEAVQLTTRSALCGDTQVPGTIECLSTVHVPHGLMSRLIADSPPGRRKLFRWGVLDVLEPCGNQHECDGPRGPCPLLAECASRAKRDEQAGHITISDAVTLKGRVSEATWQSEMLCLRPRRSDSVYPEFDPATHVVDDPPLDPADKELLWLGGMDFGYRAPTVVLWAARDAHDRLFIVDERSVAGATLPEHIAAIIAAPWPRPAWLGVDPAGAQPCPHTGKTSRELLDAAGLRTRSRRLEVSRGVGLVRARLRPATGGPRLFIHRRCRSLIRSLERYHYPPDDPESLDPVKDGHDHAADALRYLVVCLDHAHRLRAASYTGETER